MKDDFYAVKAWQKNNIRGPSSLFLNKELSWLNFSHRVLEEGMDPNTPLMERLKFLLIFTANIDEFFMLRSVHINQSQNRRELRQSIRKKISTLLTLKENYLEEKILPEFKEHGIEILSFSQLSVEQKQNAHDYFHKKILPFLSFRRVSFSDFPFLNNLTFYLLAFSENKEDMPLGLVEIPSMLPRLIAIDNFNFLRLEDLIRYCLNDLAACDFSVKESFLIRVTRNLKSTSVQLPTLDVLKAVKSELINRQHREAVRLELEKNLPTKVRSFLLKDLDLDENDVYVMPQGDGIEALNSAKEFFPQLRWPPFQPKMHKLDLYSFLAHEDLLCHHPYDCFSVVLDFIQKAAFDSQVVAIKVNIYRTSRRSEFLQSLISAAENGKEVLVVMELKARFDEENNIKWSERLKKAGVKVVFVELGLKIHGKMALIIRQEGGQKMKYAHLTTGNYNEESAQSYVDLGLFTCKKKIVAEVSLLFELLEQSNTLSQKSILDSTATIESFQEIFVAPINLKKCLLQKIDQEMEYKSKGFIQAKMNALTDYELIKKLYQASQEGVEIKLIVRGMCLLKPGLPGFSENIKVISIVDQFLEHSRIFHFRSGGQNQVYLSSADWMPRNMDERIEIMFPLLEEKIKTHVIEEIFPNYWQDHVKARVLMADGSYQKRQKKPGHSISAQRKFRQNGSEKS